MHLSAQQLQAMMRHTAYATTERYINLAHQLNGTADKLSVPKLGDEEGSDE